MGVPYRFIGLTPHQGSLAFPTYYVKVQLDAAAAIKASEMKLEKKVERELEKHGKELMNLMKMKHDRPHYAWLKGMLPMYFSVPGNAASLCASDRHQLDVREDFWYRTHNTDSPHQITALLSLFERWADTVFGKPPFPPL